MPLPGTIRDENHLEELLSDPSTGVMETLARLDGDLVFLGVGGKMGPSMARMAQRALHLTGKNSRVYGVARFSQAGLMESLHSHGIEPIRCDLLDPDQVGRLPDVANVVAMVGMKFGCTGQEALTWATNVHVPAVICQKYRRSRIVTFSTGNVYGFCPVVRGGSVEGDPLHPIGEYSQSCVGRERMYEHFSRSHGIPMALLRLNYAAEMRYGVLVDVAQRVQAEQPVNVTMGYLNAIWQGDANAMGLCAFDHVAVPPRILNVAGPDLLSVRRAAEEFGELLGKSVIVEGAEAGDAYLSNAQESLRLFGSPRVSAKQLMHWIADWTRRGGRTFGKPTHFQVRDGKF
jgi:nucleoside-diphosphate-sugar epimerase